MSRLKVTIAIFIVLLQLNCQLNENDADESFSTNDSDITTSQETTDTGMSFDMSFQSDMDSTALDQSSFVSCVELDEDVCKITSACEPVYAKPLDEETGCILAEQFVECIDSDKHQCGDDAVISFRHKGRCYFQGQICLHSDWEIVLDESCYEKVDREGCT